MLLEVLLELSRVTKVKTKKPAQSPALAVNHKP